MIGRIPKTQISQAQTIGIGPAYSNDTAGKKGFAGWGIRFGEINTMKTTLLGLCFLCATAAFGQSAGGAGALSNEVQVFQMTSHAQHASQQPMAQEQSLLEHSGSLYVEGERPLWEVQPPAPPPTPLGDIARMLRKEHEASKKADFVRND